MRHKPILNLLLLGVAGMVEASGQQPAPRPGIRLVAVGEVRNVDNSKRMFELRSLKYSSESPNSSSGASVGIRIGRGNSAPSNRFPDATRGEPRMLPPDGPLTPTPESDRFPEVIMTKVFITDGTVCKEAGKVILCGDLKTSDDVNVTGEEKNSDPRGKGLYASEIVRMPDAIRK